MNSHKNVFMCVRTKYATRHNHTHTETQSHTQRHTHTHSYASTQRETERNDSTLFGKSLLRLDLFHTAFLRPYPPTAPTLLQVKSSSLPMSLPFFHLHSFVPFHLPSFSLSTFPPLILPPTTFLHHFMSLAVNSKLSLLPPPSSSPSPSRP